MHNKHFSEELKLKSEILNVARKVKRIIFPPISDRTEKRLLYLSNSCIEYIQKNNVKPKHNILWPTLFNQDHTWWAHDSVLISALRLRGCNVIPTMCDKLQADQCMIHSGVWQGSFEAGFTERRKSLCDQCVKNDLKLWKILKITPLKLSEFLNEKEREEVWLKVTSIMKTDWENYQYDGYPVGHEVWKAVTNNNLQGDIKSYWKDNAFKMAEHHLFNVLALFEVYRKVFHHYKIDRVVGNGGYYYQWGVVNHICQQIKIPYYRYYPTGLQAMSWNYALNTTEIVHLGPAWDSWQKQDWTAEKIDKVIRDLSVRKLYVSLEDKPEIQERIKKIINDKKINQNKPTLLALTGVIWDANTNTRSKSFRNMYEWLWKSIEWFAVHPEYQMIIRVHPAENIVPSVAPQERSRFQKELQEEGIVIPDNVIVIFPEEKIETYDLMHIAKVGATYMSTTGLEFSCLGKPLIAIGPVHYAQKGFTFDPKSDTDYFTLLDSLLKNWTADMQKEYQTRAMKYWYLYAFHASALTGLFETNQKDWLSIKRGIDVFSSYPKLISAEDILPGKNPYIDYYCDSIINALPIVAENRWPPELSEALCSN